MKSFQKFPAKFPSQKFPGLETNGIVSTHGNFEKPTSTEVCGQSFQDEGQEISTLEHGNFPPKFPEVSCKVSRCPACNAHVNPVWKRCLACDVPLKRANGTAAENWDERPDPTAFIEPLHAETEPPATRAVYEYRLTDSPSWLVLLAPRVDLNNARRILEAQFGEDRLVEIRPKHGEARK